MIASVRHKIAILALTKTGTTAIETAVSPYCEVFMSGAPGLKHMTLRKFNRFVRPILETVGCQAETVCLVREPEDWLGSWYRYRQRPNIPNPANSTEGITFEEFVEAYLSPEQPGFAQIGHPARFVEDADGHIGVDHIFQYEQFGAFVNFIEQKFARRFVFPRQNTSPKMKLELSSKLRERLKREMVSSYDLHARARR